MSTATTIERCDREIAACENGDYGDGPLWLYCMGLGDWMKEYHLIVMEMIAKDGVSRFPRTGKEITQDRAMEIFKNRVLPRIQFEDGPLGTQCWIIPWNGSTYPSIKVRAISPKSIPVHRLSFVADHGGIPLALHVLHRCDRKRCCNPAHLFCGTPADNIHDMLRKNRQNYSGVKRQIGPLNHATKLTAEDVIAIRSSDESDRPLAEQFKVAKSLIWAIRKRQIWKHILGWADWHKEKHLIELEEMAALKAPFPWFGGKSRVADLVWDRFGNTPNYVEPFFGSGAVLLARPHAPRTETVNDLDCYLANFWRSVRMAPEETARWADWPVNEADLLARHNWLVSQKDFQVSLKSDPTYFDPRIAGWWVWGLCSWIGSGWCVQRGDGPQPSQIPHLGDAGRGLNRKLPHLGDAGRAESIIHTFKELSERLRDVRVACGEWDRVLGESVTIKHGTTAVFLDPPYGADEHTVSYSADSDIAHLVREWAIANGDNSGLRIALCGYQGEHDMPESWECVHWKARGGYGSQGTGAGRENSSRERIWFSPHCLRMSLFDAVAEK